MRGEYFKAFVKMPRSKNHARKCFDLSLTKLATTKPI